MKYRSQARNEKKIGVGFSQLTRRVLCAFFIEVFCLVLSFSLLAACAWPQSELATVFGTVTDQSGAVLPAAQIFYRQPKHWIEAKRSY